MNPRETIDMMCFIRPLRDDLGITILLIEHLEAYLGSPAGQPFGPAARQSSNERKGRVVVLCRD